MERSVASASVMHTEVASPETILLAARAGGDPEQGHVNTAREAGRLAGAARQLTGGVSCGAVEVPPGVGASVGERRHDSVGLMGAGYPPREPVCQPTRLAGVMR